MRHVFATAICLIFVADLIAQESTEAKIARIEQAQASALATQAAMQADLANLKVKVDGIDTKLDTLLKVKGATYTPPVGGNGWYGGTQASVTMNLVQPKPAAMTTYTPPVMYSMPAASTYSAMPMYATPAMQSYSTRTAIRPGLFGGTVMRSSGAAACST